MFRPLVLIIAVVIVLSLVLFNTTYVVNFHEVAIRARFAQDPTIVRDAGLHVKAPLFIDSVTKLDKRIQLVETPLETVLTRDGQQIVIRAFLFWQIDTADQAPLDFYKEFGSIDGAQKILTGMLQGSLRQAGGFAFSELIGRDSKLEDAEQAILADLRVKLRPGIKAVQVGIPQVVLPPKTTTAVLSRMGGTQESLAALEATRANSMADALKSTAASQADTIRNLVKVWGQEIESRGDLEAERFYKQMQKETELATFLAWLDTLRASLTGSTTFVSDMSRAPFHLLDPDAPTDAMGIPQPTQDAAGQPVRPPAGASGASGSSGAPGASASPGASGKSVAPAPSGAVAAPAEGKGS